MLSTILFPEQKKMERDVDLFCRHNYTDQELTNFIKRHIEMSFVLGMEKLNELQIGKTKQDAKKMYLKIQLELMEIKTIKNQTNDAKENKNTGRNNN